MDDGRVLERLLARYSPSGREAGAVREFVRLARELGFRTRVDAAGNGVAEVGRGRPIVLFLGHIDTVEGRRPVRRQHARLHGRGAVDAKGALAAALLAGRGLTAPGTFRVVAAVREETDSRGACHVARGPRPDAVIAGEPSGWDGVTIGYKGDLRLEATFRARRTHWSSPFPTAADVAVSWLGQVRTLGTGGPSGSLFRALTVKVVGLVAEPSADPEVARVTVDVRIPPGRSTAEVLTQLRGLPGTPSLRTIARVEAYETVRADPVVLALTAAIRDAGGRPTLWRRGGTSDLNVVGRAWSLGGAAYGPGNSRLDHTDREVLSVAELRRAASVLRGTVVRLLDRGPTATPPRSDAVP
jgi:LysW-gamma-L-lysine carboxypeptidase